MNTPVEEPQHGPVVTGLQVGGPDQMWIPGRGSRPDMDSRWGGPDQMWTPGGGVQTRCSSWFYGTDSFKRRYGFYKILNTKYRIYKILNTKYKKIEYKRQNIKCK